MNSLIIIDVVLTFVIMLFLFKPKELKFKSIIIYLALCAAFTPIGGAILYYIAFRD